MLTLYTLPTCPFCAKVKNAFHVLDLSFTELDIDTGDNEKKLLELGGKRQVPYLVDDEKGVRMYESSDIVEYLEKNYGHS